MDKIVRKSRGKQTPLGCNENDSTWKLSSNLADLSKAAAIHEVLRKLGRSILKFMSSLHLGIVLIGLVAAACIAGSLVASNENLGVDYGREYVFHTPWFLGLMGLLLVNLCLCSWEKSYIALTLYKKRNFQKNPRFYKAAGHGVAFPYTGSQEALEKELKKTYSVTAKSGTGFYSQKGLFGRAGATIIHIGLLWTMLAGFYRILADDFRWGVYDATIILPEGQFSTAYVTRKNRLKDPSGDNLLQRSMPFMVRCLDFDAQYFPHSTVAKGFASTVELVDGDFRRIYEVSMTHPILHKGYKITQNSFSPNEHINRGKFRVTDTKTGKFTDVDLSAGDPVRIRGFGDKAPWIQVDALSAETRFHILDMDKGKVLQDGNVVKPEAMPLPIDMRPFAEELAQSRYSIMVAALFPNFTFDEDKQPTTRDEKFENPAVMVMLFKNGRPNGYMWLFLNPEAQKIVGQPHPELDLTFVNFRKKSDSPADQPENIYSYEVELQVTEKASGHSLGSVWLSAGQLKELQVSPALLKSGNIRMDQLSETHGSSATSGTEELASNHDHTSGTTETAPADALTSAGPLENMSSTATLDRALSEAETTASASDNPSVPAGRYQVEYMGMTNGHVTFLGFMKDPSVAWLFAGCIIIIGGTLIAFMLVYRETWAYYDPETGLLYMATAVRGTSPAAHREFDRLIDRIKAIPPAKPQSAPVTSSAS